MYTERYHNCSLWEINAADLLLVRWHRSITRNKHNILNDTKKEIITLIMRNDVETTSLMTFKHTLSLYNISIYYVFARLTYFIFLPALKHRAIYKLRKSHQKSFSSATSETLRISRHWNNHCSYFYNSASIILSVLTKGYKPYQFTLIKLCSHNRENISYFKWGSAESLPR